MAKSKKTTPITLNKLDAVFGRGRKRDHVRNGSVYRGLIEKYWKTYAEMDPSKFAMRRAFVQTKILDVVIRKGGRFIMRAATDMSELHPSNVSDLRLIFKKVQRALFNEKKRQEAKQNRSFKSKHNTFEPDAEEVASSSLDMILGTSSEEEDDIDMSAPITPSSSSADEDNCIYADDEEDEDSDDEEEQQDSVDDDDDFIVRPVTRSAVVSPLAKKKPSRRVSVYSDDEDFKMVGAMNYKMAVAEQFADAEMFSDSEDVKAIMVANESSNRRSSEKLDCLAEIAASLLEKGNDDDAKKPASRKADVSFAVVETSKPLKKRKHRAAAAKKPMAEPSQEFNRFWMERITLKPRVGGFEQHCEEHFFKAF
ncbi:expressed unknown protein [Seminavis robusta]|uniref:Uncharacterized protein n=1 Tax=Seminavis robusta TaxID=568900 RepID=A0A9N8DRJ8_9STRA|nr:expressed unknown protein [Seminavis robusta]|eukprot:Sro319_g116370.1 n/a (367) ;mRNA; r:72051-73151